MNDNAKEWPHRICAMKDNGDIIYSVIGIDIAGNIRMLSMHIDRTPEEIYTMLVMKIPKE